jgi:hypothetical protein
MRAFAAMLGAFSGSLATLRTDLANLARQLLTYTPLTEFQKLVDLVNWIYAKVNQPAAFIFYGDDKFLDTSQSAVGTNVDGAYSADIREGLRFPGGGAGATLPLQLGNPSEPLIQSYDNYVLPKPSGSRIRYDCSFPNFPWIPERILAHPYWAFTCRNLYWSRWRWRCGPQFLPLPDATVWWYQAQVDPVFAALVYDAEIAVWTQRTWRAVTQHAEDDVYWPRYWSDRYKYFWRDGVNLPYWGLKYDDFSHSGNHVVQTFYNAQDGWLSGVTLYSHKPNFFQPVTIVISGCDDQGKPDHANQTLRRVVLDAAAIETCYGSPIRVGDVLGGYQGPYFSAFTVPAQPIFSDGSGYYQQVAALEASGFEIIAAVAGQYITYSYLPSYVFPLRMDFPPVYLRAGQQIAIHVHSTFDHQFSVCDRDAAYQVHQGHFWHYDGQYGLAAWLTSPKTLRFLAHFATWGRWGDQASPGGGLRYEIPLQTLQLGGGIGNVDVLADAIVPAVTDLSFQLLIGGQWRRFDYDPNSPGLSGSDTTLQFRAVFSGTTDLMPGLSIQNSQVKLGRAPALLFHHISTVITFGSATNLIKVIVKLVNYVEANHDCNVYIKVGAGARQPYNTTRDDVQADGSIYRTNTYTVSGVTAVQVEIDGLTNGTGDNFVVGQRIIYCT